MSLVAADAKDVALGKHMALVQQRFLLTLPSQLVSPARKKIITKNLLSEIEERSMLSFYRETATLLDWKEDKVLVGKLEGEETKALKELDAKLEDARANHGEIEIFDNMMEKAQFWANSGDKAKALEALDSALKEKCTTQHYTPRGLGFCKGTIPT